MNIEGLAGIVTWSSDILYKKYHRLTRVKGSK
jgi:hypothetical protein